MQPISVMALFCEDVREEKSGQYSLIGIFGDNVNIPPVPPETPSVAFGIIPKIFAYVRFSFDVNTEVPTPIMVSIRAPDGSLIPGAEITSATIEEARKTRDAGNPIAGIFVKMQMGGPIVPVAGGRLVVEATIGEERYIAGTLNLVPSAETTSTSAQ